MEEASEEEEPSSTFDGSGAGRWTSDEDSRLDFEWCEGGRRLSPSVNLKVLLVEDDELTRKVLSRLLVTLDFQVVAAKNAKQALQLLCYPENASGLDAILTDEQMPHMTGLQLATTLSGTRWSHIPVFLMSSDVSERMIQQATAAGVGEVLSKPIQRSYLSALQSRLRRRRHLLMHEKKPCVSEDRVIVNGSHGGKVVRPLMKRAVSLDNHHVKPSKQARVAEQLLKIAESQQETPQGTESSQGDMPVKPKPQRLSNLLPAKSLPEAYDIRCYSLPLISKDFLRSPVGSTPKLQIQPLDITVGLFPDNNGGSKNLQKEGTKVAASPSQLHHSTSSSAFQRLKNTIVQGALNKTAQNQLRPPAFMPAPTKAEQAHQQRFSKAVQVAMKRRKQAETCAINRRAAILRFRAKRQQRSFEKKVRYASRKRLADQRPRIKGQFVKAADLQKANAE